MGDRISPHPDSLGNAAQFQQVSATSAVGIGENWTQQAKVPLLQVAPPACSLEEPSKYLTHEAFTCLRQLEMKDASPQFFPPQSVTVPTY